MTSQVADVLRSLSAALRQAGARWYLFGAQAALLHGASRLTADVDATVQWERPDASRRGSRPTWSSAGPAWKSAGQLDLAYIRGVLRELEQALDRSDLVPVLDAAVAEV